MANRPFVGYSPKLYEALQIVAHQEFAWEPSDEYPPTQSWASDDFEDHMSLCLAAISGHSDAYDIIEKYFGYMYLEQLINQIDDINLRDLIATGKVSRFEFNDQGYYLVELEESA